MKGAIIQYGSDYYVLDKNYTFTWDGTSWTSNDVSVAQLAVNTSDILSYSVKRSLMNQVLMA